MEVYAIIIIFFFSGQFKNYRSLTNIYIFLACSVEKKKVYHLNMGMRQRRSRSPSPRIPRKRSVHREDRHKLNLYGKITPDTSRFRRMQNTLEEWFKETMRRIDNNLTPVNIIRYEHTLSSDNIKWISRHFFENYKIITCGVDYDRSFDIDRLVATLELQDKYGLYVMSEMFRRSVIFIQESMPADKVHRFLELLDITSITLIFSGQFNNAILEHVTKIFKESSAVASEKVKSYYGQLSFNLFSSDNLSGLRLWQHWHPGNTNDFTVTSYYTHLFRDYMNEDERKEREPTPEVHQKELIDASCQADISRPKRSRSTMTEMDYHLIIDEPPANIKGIHIKPTPPSQLKEIDVEKELEELRKYAVCTDEPQVQEEETFISLRNFKVKFSKNKKS